jgi:hypothetical protein
MRNQYDKGNINWFTSTKTADTTTNATTNENSTKIDALDSTV